ncbi:MAG: four-carbon acid sugar kinase family protein [Chloroflexi bacterium AL-N5]|nr:four-carbon acid sugar kinase family protein [Chloroflexi bacterium AL-N5]
MSYLLTFYGDDFTGSTDVMEALTLGGVPTVLLLESLPPEEVQAQFPKAQAVGLAGTSRSMTRAQMAEVLPKAFNYLKSFGANVVHYKVCSTFDSSPEIGSIGQALELGLEVFPQTPVPMVVGAPILKRYVVFGNLFATVQGETYRLDRHPTMSVHPVTPMNESDLRRHLTQQTSRSVKLYDLLALARRDDLSHYADADVLLFDTVNAEHQATIGEILYQYKAPFWVGSSGMEYALIAHLQATGQIRARQVDKVNAVSQLLVISGSAAPVTASQIAWAERHGFVGIRLDSLALIDDSRAESYVAHIIDRSECLLRQGKSVILYSAKGPDDPAIMQTKLQLERLGWHPNQVSSLLGKQQGSILKGLLERYPLPRVCVSGGDTCGHAVMKLGLTALELLMPIAPGSPLCKAHSSNQHNGLEISLKAGQVGREDYFASVLSGQVPACVN